MFTVIWFVVLHHVAVTSTRNRSTIGKHANVPLWDGGNCLVPELTAIILCHGPIARNHWFSGFLNHDEGIRGWSFVVLRRWSLMGVMMTWWLMMTRWWAAVVNMTTTTTTAALFAAEAVTNDAENWHDTTAAEN